MAEMRHAAAHGFDLDFKLAEFQTAVRASLRLLAFTFDTCVSQAAFSLRRAISNDVVHDIVEPAKFALRIIRFDSLNTRWDVQMNGASTGSWTSGQFNNKLAKLQAQAAMSGETSLVIDGSGNLQMWVQPM